MKIIPRVKLKSREKTSIVNKPFRHMKGVKKHDSAWPGIFRGYGPITMIIEGDRERHGH
jgi:hypothetical protein